MITNLHTKKHFFQVDILSYKILTVETNERAGAITRKRRKKRGSTLSRVFFNLKLSHCLSATSRAFELDPTGFKPFNCCQGCSTFSHAPENMRIFLETIKKFKILIFRIKTYDTKN